MQEVIPNNDLCKRIEEIITDKAAAQLSAFVYGLSTFWGLINAEAYFGLYE